MILENELTAAIAAVQAASRLTRRVRDSTRLGTLKKGDRSPVTVADFGSQAVVCRVLQQAFPNDPVIAEEDSHALREAGNSETLARVTEHVQGFDAEADSGDVLAWIDRGSTPHGEGRFWTLDPIDGTKGFLRGDQYAVALALIEDGRPIVGALACPGLVAPDGSTGVIVAAVVGQGTMQHPLDDMQHAEAVRVTATQDPSRAVLSESVEGGHSSHDDSARASEILGIMAAPNRMDSQAKYAVVARGETDLYMRLPVRPGYTERIWDHAAGTLVVQEAGGMVTDVLGAPLDFSHGALLKANKGVVATNGHLHRSVLEALASLGIGR